MSEVQRRFGLTAQQAEFVRLVARGMTVQTAAESAGYATSTTSTSVRNAPAVQEAIRFEIQRYYGTVGAGAAFRVLLDIVNDEREAKKLRAEAGKALLDRVGWAPARAADGAQSKDLADMAPDEIAAFLRNAQAELARRADGAKLIDSAPVGAQREPDVDELF